MSIEEKKLMELMVSFDSDEWWHEQEDYDENEEYDELSAPTRTCIFCGAWEYVNNPNIIEHEDNCPALKLSMILYGIDFRNIDYKREEVQI
jgi:hypothetical protein